MKIAWFTHRYHPCHGGSETYGREIVRRFVDRGHEVDVFTSDAEDLWYFNDRRRRRLDAPASEIVDGARVRRFAVRHFPAQRYVGRLLSYVPHWPTRCRWESYMPVIPELGRDHGRYDAVFGLGFPFTVFSYAAYRTARASGAPLVLTPFLHLSTPGDVVNRHYTRPHQVRLLAESDLVVVQTDLERDAVVGWGLPEHQVRRLGMAVHHDHVTGGDRDAFRARLGIRRDEQVVGYLGVSDPNKGTTDLVNAIAQLNASRPAGAPIRLVLGGNASPDFERFLDGLDASFQDWLIRLGPLPAEDVKHFYATLDAFAMPSRTDSFGIVYLEAWANRLPVVAAAAGGVREVVRDEVDGLLVPFGDVEKLAGALARILDAPDLATRLGSAGQHRVSRGYGWDDRFLTLSNWLIELLVARAGIPAPHAVRSARGSIDARRVATDAGRP